MTAGRQLLYAVLAPYTAWACVNCEPYSDSSCSIRPSSEKDWDSRYLLGGPDGLLLPLMSSASTANVASFTL